MSTPIDFLFGPFIETESLRNAFIGSALLALGACPIGAFLILRRMSLTVDALSHAILPGIAVAFLIFGLSYVPMVLGGLGAGLVVALLSGMVSRTTMMREDASFASFYLISLALGVAIITARGESDELVHVLFGSVLNMNATNLLILAATSGLTLLALVFMWRGLVLECLDPLYFRSVSKAGPVIHLGFLVLVVLNLVGGFQALGTLLGGGLMLLPAIIAQFWTRRLVPLCLFSVAIGLCSCWLGLLASYHLKLEAAPAIILVAGLAYVISLVLAPRGLVQQLRHQTVHQSA